MSALYVSNARSNISRTGYETIESLISRLALTFSIEFPQNIISMTILMVYII